MSFGASDLNDSPSAKQTKGFIRVVLMDSWRNAFTMGASARTLV